MTICATDDCTDAGTRRGYCHRCYERLRHRGEITRMHPLPVADRFWLKVDRRGDDECWPWLGYINPRTGYGQITIPKAHRDEWRGQRIVTAPVVGCTLQNGPRPEGMWVLHACDNRACANPSHLRWGTPTENIREAVARGRHHGPRLVEGAP